MKMLTPPHRRRIPALMAAAALVCGLAACGDDDDSGESRPVTTDASGSEVAVTSITVGAVATADHAPLYVADDLGYFDEVGLDVNINAVTPGAGPLLAAMSAGDIDVLEHIPQFVGLGLEQDEHLQFFCGSWPVINATFTVADDSDMLSAADAGGWKPAVESLAGKTIGVPAMGSTTHLWAESVLIEAGMDPTDATYVQVGVGPVAIPALLEGRVDALITYPWMTEQLVAGGEARVLVAFDKDGPENFSAQMQNGWVAKASWLEENPDAARAFCEAIGQANDFMDDPANKDATSDILRTAFALDDQGVLDLLLAEDGAIPLLDTELSCDGLEAALAFAVDHDLLEASDDLNCDKLIWDGATS